MTDEKGPIRVAKLCYAVQAVFDEHVQAVEFDKGMDDVARSLILLMSRHASMADDGQQHALLQHIHDKAKLCLDNRFLEQEAGDE